MHARHLPDLSRQIFYCLQNTRNFGNWRRHRCEQERGRATTRVIVADYLERLARCFHRVAPKRAMQMKIDEPRREEIAAEINYVAFGGPPGWAHLDNFPFLRDKFTFITNSVRKNQ